MDIEWRHLVSETQWRRLVSETQWRRLVSETLVVYSTVDTSSGYECRTRNRESPGSNL